jgi:hypothetical protein
MIIGTYSGGSASAYEYTTLPELLNQMPDNVGNLIDAINIRNSVYTLWERISDVQTVASQSASASTTYTNSTPTPQTIGGIPAGSTFSNKTMSEMWDALLYPYIAPSASLSIGSLNGGSLREFGRSNNVDLNWNATKGSKNVSAIIVCIGRPDQESIALTTINSTGNQSGTKSTTSTSNTNTTFYMTVSDIPNGTSTVTAQATVSWSSAVYWGKTPTFALPSMSIVGSQPSWADGAGVGSGKNLSSSRSANYSGINGAGQYLVFAWPSSYGTPTFTINGLPNTAFTKIGSAVSHTNMYSYPVNYDVWISNTAQNSPIASFIIS